LNREEFEEFVRRNPEEALRLIVKAFKPKELLKIGNRSYANAFKYPESRFDPKDLMLNGGSLQVLKGDMLQPLRDPSKSFTDQVLIPPSQLVFSLAGRTYSKSGMPETAGMISGGLTDASAVIQSAINNLPSGGMVFIKGHIDVYSTVVLKDYVTLSGEGRGSELHANGDFPVVLLQNVKACVVKDLTIRGGGNSKLNAHGVKIVAPATECRLTRLWFHSCRNAIDVWGCFALAVEHCTAFGRGKDQNYIGVYTHPPATGVDTDGDWNAVWVMDVISHGWRLEYINGMRLRGCAAGAVGGKGFYIGAPSQAVDTRFLHVTGCLADSCAEEAWYVDGTGTKSGYIGNMQFANIWAGNSKAGFVSNKLINTVISNILFSRFKQDAIKLSSGFRVDIENGYVETWGTELANTYCGVRLVNMVKSSVRGVNFVASSPLNAIREEGTSDLNRILANDVGDGGGIYKVGRATVVKHNRGYVTENSGSATITAGSTYVDVTHGLNITPDINKIRITPKDNLGGRSFWVSNVGATTFRINISSTDTVDHAFGWSYED